MGSNSLKDKIDFHPYFFIKDTLCLFIALILFSIFIFFYPNLLGHSDNYIMANALVTPTHIVPE
jgi:ubiquinol-cytochrome c reductase cytochrome b subunit